MFNQRTQPWAGGLYSLVDLKRSVASHFETILRLTDIPQVRAIMDILNDFFTFAEIPDYTWSFADLNRIDVLIAPHWEDLMLEC